MSKSSATTSGDAAGSKPKEHWFWKYVMKSRSVYYQVIIASVLINIFALVSSLYIMTVYDRVIPNNATDSLWALTAIVVVVMGFDFVLKTLRGSFVDHAGVRLTSAFQRIFLIKSHAMTFPCQSKQQVRWPIQSAILKF